MIKVNYKQVNVHIIKGDYQDPTVNPLVGQLRNKKKRFNSYNWESEKF